MPEVFDTGPLSWVKGEIDQALNAVQMHLGKILANHSELQLMRLSQTYLYQISGALDMVGLEGCKRYCSELEKLAGKIEKSLIPVSDELIEKFQSAVQILSDYLQDLMNGSPDVPTKLYSALLPIVEVQGELIEESELFFPDTSFSLPKDTTVQEVLLKDGDLQNFVNKQRISFQLALLAWLKSPTESVMHTMQEAIENIAQLQSYTTQKTLWWSATAFIDSLKQPEIAAKLGAKRLCRRLDQQMRSLSDSNPRAFSYLLRDILYYVAISKPDTARIQAVKQFFELDALLPVRASESRVGRKVGHEEIESAVKIKTIIESLKAYWLLYLDAKPEALTTFIQTFSELNQANIEIFETAIRDLFNSIKTATTTMALDTEKITDISKMEVAVALNLLEDIFSRYQALHVDSIDALNKRSKRILASVGLVNLDDSDEVIGQSDKALLQAIAQQIAASLKIVEESLDAYFRKQENNIVLEAVYRPLQQVASAFDMLEMRTPATIAEVNATLIRHFHHDRVDQENQYYEIVAESLSMLGFYNEELLRVRPESEDALRVILVKLEVAMKQLSTEIAMIDGTMHIPVVDEISVTSKHQKSPNTIAVADKPKDQDLLEIYLTEAEEVLATVAKNIKVLKLNLTDIDALTKIRRGFHTLKGSGRTIGLTALGDVAWSVENLLNVVLENHQPFSQLYLGFVEKAAIAFAGWVADLRQDGEVSLNPVTWVQEAETLQQTKVSKAKKTVEQVLIGGTRKMSRALFDIFINEAKQHTQTLRNFSTTLQVNAVVALTDELRRAAHTLGSNALTAGFTPMGELARALERWLDVHHGAWIEQSIGLYKNTAETLISMLTKAEQKRNLRASRALMAALDKATAFALDTMQRTDAAQDALVISIAPAASDVLDSEIESSKTVSEVKQNTSRKIKKTAQPVFDLAEQEVLTMFIEEARELLPQIGKQIREWQVQPEDIGYSDTLQRALHTLKGSARMAGQTLLADTVHGMEDRVIQALKTDATSTDFEAMFEGLDKVGAMYEGLVGDGNSQQVTEVISSGQSLLDPKQQLENKTNTKSDRKAQFLRLRTDVLERLINDAGEISITRSRMEREMQNVKHSSQDLTESVTRLRAYLRELEIEAETQMQSRMTSLQEANETFDPLEFDRYTRLQELTRMMAESVNDVSTIQHNMLSNLDHTDAALQQQNRMNRELQQNLLGVRLLPFAILTERFQRIVRQTSRELKKPVNLIIDGEDVEIDRSVLDKIVAPLEHLLRNAVAHGLEDTATRKAANKSEIGSIQLKIRQENEEIVINVSDDGAGIHLEKVREKAVQNHMFTPDQIVSEETLLSVIFEPGFSTATNVSQIAGRGVGLDVVRSDISELGGRIDVNNAIGQGVTFTIFLPLTQSVSQVVMVRAGQHIFAVPAVMVEQVQKLKAQDLSTAYEASAISWNDAVYSLHYLARLIGDITHKPEAQKYTPVLLLRSANYRIALHVDEVVSNQEVVLKPIGPQLARVPGMVGATVTGDGGIILLINPVQLANRETLTVGAIKVNTTLPVTPVKTKNIIMVVDDSLTMRKVLGRLLEREGFDVVTAKDGMDALQILQEMTPDVILTDIEMPRMDGFELTRNIKDDARLRGIPLAMISSRTAEKHQSYARELGVDVFLGKPAHDDDVLNTVNQFLRK